MSGFCEKEAELSIVPIDNEVIDPGITRYNERTRGNRKLSMKVWLCDWLFRENRIAKEDEKWQDM